MATLSTKKKDPAVFRRCSDKAILNNFSSVFDNGQRLAVWSAVAAVNWQTNAKYGTLPMSEPEHEASDRAFYSTEGSVEKVDIFVSHVWASLRWQKALTLLYNANISIAVYSSFLSWILAVIWTIVARDRDLVQLGGEYLAPQMVYLPVCVFFFVFFHGHHRPWRKLKTVWIDKLCIHQTREDLKVAGVSLVPEFVSNSKRMSILWCSTYFERLWCICEVATFTSSKGGAEAVDFDPLWRAPWVLSIILVDLVCITFSVKLMFLIPIASTAVQDVIGDGSPPVVNLLGAILGVGSAFGIGYIPALIPNYFLFRYKISNHEMMRSQISRFSLAETKTTMESDRKIVEGHVVRLFKKHDAEPAELVCQRFNEFMQTTFLDTMTNRLGPVTWISYGQSLLATLPLIFSSASDILGCDGLHCSESAAATGFQNPYIYILSNVLSWLVGCLLVYPTTYPVMLRGMYWFRNSRWEKAGCALTVVTAYLFMGLIEGAVMGLVTNSMTLNGLKWKVYFAASLLALIQLNVFLFRKH